jgi:hypothetical protein
MYGPKNKFNNSFSNEELANVTSNELIQKIKTLISTNKPYYYGPKDIKAVVSELKSIRFLLSLLLLLHQKNSNKQKTKKFFC